MCTLPSESRTAADLWLRPFQSSCWFVGTSPRSHRKPAGRSFIGENVNIGATVWVWLLLTPPHRGPRTTVHLVFAAFLSLYYSCHFELLQLEFMCDSCVDNVHKFITTDFILLILLCLDLYCQQLHVEEPTELSWW